METATKILAGALAIKAAFIFIMLLSPLIGYVVGWLFEVVFTETWSTMHTYLNMPSNLSGGMLGAFLATFGGLGFKSFAGKRSDK